MVPTLDSRSNLDVLYVAILFTLVRLKLDPRLHVFVPTFEQLRTECTAIVAVESSLVGDRMDAEARVDKADANIDRTSDGVASVVLLETKNNRKAPLFTRYFGTTQPSRFRKSVLGPQLAAMRTWPPSLKESKIPALVAYGEALIPQIAAADEALTFRAAAQQKMTDFRTFGKRKELYNKVNGARKQLHGEVSKMIHEFPEWNLTVDFVNALFEHESASPDISNAELEQKIISITNELVKLTALQEQRVKDQEAAAAALIEEEKKAKLSAIEVAQKAADEAVAKLVALKATMSSPDA